MESNFKNVIDITEKEKKSGGIKQNVVIPFISGVLGCSLVLGTCFGVPSIKQKIVGNSVDNILTSPNLQLWGTKSIFPP